MTYSPTLRSSAQVQPRPSKTETPPLPLLWSQLKPEEQQQLAQQPVSLIHRIRAQSQRREGLADASD